MFRNIPGPQGGASQCFTCVYVWSSVTAESSQLGVSLSWVGRVTKRTRFNAFTRITLWPLYCSQLSSFDIALPHLVRSYAEQNNLPPWLFPASRTLSRHENKCHIEELTGVRCSIVALCGIWRISSDWPCRRDAHVKRAVTPVRACTTGKNLNG